MTFRLIVSLCCLFFALAGRPVVAQTIDNLSSLDFGSFDFALSHNVTIQLATNGSLSVIGSGAVSNGGESVGHIRITSPDTGLLNIKCSATAVLSDPTAVDLTIDQIEMAVNTGTSFGNAFACHGTGAGAAPAVIIDVSALNDPDIYIGGQVVVNNVSSFPSDRTYSTVGAGSPISFSIVVQ